VADPSSKASRRDRDEGTAGTDAFGVDLDCSHSSPERAHCFTKRYLGFANCMAIAIIAHIGNPMTTHSKNQTNYTTNVDTDTTTQCTLDHNQPRRGNDVAPHTFQKVKLLKVMANPKSIDIPTNAQRGLRTDDVIVEG